MSEVSNLKLKLSSVGKDRLDFDSFQDNEVCGAELLSLLSRTHSHGFTPERGEKNVVLDSKQLWLVRSQRVESAFLNSAGD